MWKTALLLIVTIVVVPAIAIAVEPPLPVHIRDTLKVLVAIYVVSALLCFLVSTLADNYSQVDKLWSIMPIIYAWVACFLLGFEPRLMLMAVLVSIWGARLTRNFARRDGYKWPFWKGEEDYRWAEVRKRPEFSNPVAWGAFNLFFISLYQMGLILLFTLPIVKAAGGAPLGVFDVLLAGIFVWLVWLEGRADNQQWVFQSKKYEYLNKGEPLPEAYAHGFVRTGLWGRVRHPNYAAEQAVWIVFYLFTIVATGQWLNWSVMGALLLVILFRSSSSLSEDISAEKYPDYRDYQNKVPRFVPRLFSKQG